MDTQEALSPVLAIIWVLVGIIISLLLPVAVKSLNNTKTTLESLEGRKPPTWWERFATAWKKYGGKHYVITLLAASLVAVVIVFLLGMKFNEPRDAALAGFAWESFISKLYIRTTS